jgi:stage II sporulation protein D
VTPLLLLLSTLLAVAPTSRTVEVELLSSKPCQALSVEGPGGWRNVALRDGHLLLDGRTVESPLQLSSGTWHIRVPAPAERTVTGEIDIRAGDGRLRLIARIPLEDYVGWTVASETEPGTPAEALKAQAVVARSYALASGRRHADVDLCDLAHCQLLRGGLAPAHLEAGRRAAEATRGEVLRLSSGRIAEAVFHAACGGHTADPREVFGGEGTGAAAVPDDGCPARPWHAMMPKATFESVVRERLGTAMNPESLEWRRGQGGYVVQVALGERVLGGEVFARALDGRMGHRAIRSARMTATTTSQGVLLEGTGVGHGVGLCQAGAARRASAGSNYREMLRHYYPRTEVGP